MTGKFLAVRNLNKFEFKQSLVLFYLRYVSKISGTLMSDVCQVKIHLLRKLQEKSLTRLKIL